MIARMSLIPVCGAALAIIVAAGPARAGAATVGPALEVAPKVENTRLQKWPRGAWAADSKCWLVVWREGDVTEQDSNICCARISADGKALDPAGIAITKVKGLKDQPAVASDGKGFLIVWQDLRNGKDWDVYAARVSAEGKALDPDGFLVAGGERNQCLPTAAFAGGNHHLAWQNFVEDALAKGYGSYEIRGVRVNPEGKALEAEAGGTKLVAATGVLPALAADGNGGLCLAWMGRSKKGVPAHVLSTSFGMLPIDAAKGAPQGTAAEIQLPRDSSLISGETAACSPVWLKDAGGLLAVTGYRGGTTVFRFDKDGHKVGEPIKFRNYSGDNTTFRFSMASDGERVLLTQDFFQPAKKRDERAHLAVWGWLLSPDGKVLDGGKDGIAIAAEADKDQLQGFACAGPKGTFLVVYAEPRGGDDTKVLARMVK